MESESNLKITALDILRKNAVLKVTGYTLEYWHGFCVEAEKLSI